MREGYVRGGHTGTFVLLAILSAITAAISTWLAVKYHDHHNYINIAVRDRTRLICFTSWLTLVLSILYATLFRLNSSVIVSVGSHLVWLVLIWIFWTASAASITAALGGGINCSHVPYEVVYCNQLNAEMGFSWACWVITTWAVIVILIFGIKSTRRGEGWRGGLA